MRQGMNTRVSTVAKMMPTAREMAMGMRKRACRSFSNSREERPPAVVAVVRNTARKRRDAAWRKASKAGIPRR
jgi:hypothetical protein